MRGKLGADEPEERRTLEKVEAGRLPIPPGLWFVQPQLGPAVKQGFESTTNHSQDPVYGGLKSSHLLYLG